MSQRTATSDRTAPIDLAREPDFALGPAQVRPSIGEVTVGGDRIRLQPRVMQVLVALARAEAEVVSRDDLVASCWGGLAIGDDAINRCVQRLRRLAETEAPGAFAIETLPRIGYRLDRTGGDPSPSPAPPAPRSWLGPWRIGAAGLLALALAAAVWFGLGAPGWPSGGQGVAVMPFDAPAGDAPARDFAHGVAGEVASGLAKSDLISVPADSNGPLSDLARDALSQRLGAAYTLSGRVQRAGSALDVNVSIDDARAHQLLWSADFSRDASEAQDLQEEVAAKVARVLHCALATNSPQTGQLDLEAVRLYLRACDAINADEDQSIQTHARDQFRAVARRQPRFASAWADFAWASANAAQAWSGDARAQAASDAREAANRALQLDPRSPLAYAALEAIAPPADLAQRQAFLLKGLAVAPDSAVLNAEEGRILSEVGRVGDQFAYMRRAVELDPLDPASAATLAYATAQHGWLVQGRAMIERDVRIWPHSEEIRAVRLAIEARYGDPAAALRLLANPTTSPRVGDADLQDWRDFVLARQSGDPAKIAAYAKQVIVDVEKDRMSVAAAITRLSSIGAVDATFLAASKGTAGDSVDTEPFFRLPAAVVRADPRFLPLMAKTGVLAFWRRTGKWADFCEAGDRPYDCQAIAAKLGL